MELLHILSKFKTTEKPLNLTAPVLNFKKV